MLIVERGARGASLACGVELDVAVRGGYRDLRNNLTLARRFGAHLAAHGRTARERDEGLGAGSTDMGDVSHAIPAIHPYLAIVDEGACTCHERPFAAAAGSERGVATALVAAKALARTAIELLADGELRTAVLAEHQRGGG